MIGFGNILKEFNSTLSNLEFETDDVILKSEKGIKIAKAALKKLREAVASNSFKTNEEEISFFKNIKPQVYGKLIYYAKLFCIESRKSKGSSKSQIIYYTKYVDRFQAYFNDNLEFYQYYRKGATIFDEQYFLRGKEDIRLFPDTHYFYTDEEFSTSHDSTVATIIAYDLLMIHLKKEIDKLEENGNYFASQLMQKHSRITWTSQKVNLIELIYALHSTDVINNGSVDIKDIARVVERIFKIDLGDYYRAFLEIRMRKKGRTKFLDMLKENLENRMNEIDD